MVDRPWRHHPASRLRDCGAPDGGVVLDSSRGHAGLARLYPNAGIQQVKRQCGRVRAEISPQPEAMRSCDGPAGAKAAADVAAVQRPVLAATKKEARWLNQHEHG